MSTEPKARALSPKPPPIDWRKSWVFICAGRVLGYTPQPPNYQETVAVHDKFCYLCVSYKEDLCEKYMVPVAHIYTCDGWERNWDASEHP